MASAGDAAAIKKLARLDEEHSQILRELKRVRVGYRKNGLRKKITPEEDRKRKRVRRCIQYSLGKIEKKDKALYAYLDTFITRGVDCIYSPLEPVAWEL